MLVTIKKFLAFEWLMFLMVGLFWAVAVAFPLYLSNSFDHKVTWHQQILMMGLPYIVYLCLRSLWLLWRSVVWAYLTTNFFFRSEKEKVFAGEWLCFVLFGLLWAMIVSVPMYFTGMFTDEGSLIRNIGVLFLLYFLYLCVRTVWSFFMSIGWAVREISSESPTRQKNRKK